MMRHQHLQTCLLLLFLLKLLLGVAGFAGTGLKVPAIIVFGDSTVDAGNNNQIPTLARSNFEPYGRDFEGGKPTGRFCNGRLVPDFVSEYFGIKPSIPAYLDPAFSIKDFATGVTFASAATGYDNVTSDVLSVIPLWKEVEYFKEYKRKLIRYQGKEKAITTVREAIYIISIGTNDFIENYYTIPNGRSSTYTVEEYESFLLGLAEKFVLELFRLGARKISLAGLPAMGCLPLVRAINLMSPGSCNDEYNKVAKEFSEKIKGLVAKLRNQVMGLRVVYTNCYDSLLQIIDNPKQYEFEDVSLGCCGTGIFEMSYACPKSNPFTCPDATKYVFWDSIHSTEKLNGIIADYMMKTSMVEFL